MTRFSPECPGLTGRWVRLLVYLLYVLRLRSSYYEVLWAAHNHCPLTRRWKWDPAVVRVTKYARWPRWLTD